MALVARVGSTAPGTSDSFTDLGSPVLNNGGQTAFFGDLNSSSTTNSGIWSEGGGSGLALVARAGNAAPGTSDNFSSFVSPVLNNGGQTAFVGFLNSSSTTNSGIWSEGGGSGLALVAREGNAAPGTSDNFTSFGNSPVLNNAGQTAFFGFLDSSGSTDGGIWAEDPSGVLTLIAREGDLLDVDDGSGTDFRTISNLTFTGDAGNGDGRRSGFNDLGQLAFSASFTDGTSGVFISDLVASLPGSADFDNDGDVDGNDFLAWQRNSSVGNLADWENAYGTGTLAAATTVPEPTSVVLGALGLFGLLATRRRKQ